MSNGFFSVPTPVNEPVKSYAPGSPEKASIKRRLESMASEEIEIPLIIGGREVRTGNTAKAVCPHDHGHVLATYHQAGPDEIAMAVDASQEAWRDWSEMAWSDRAAVFLKAADLLAGPWRDTLNAATMLGQSKNVYQAEIDSAAELVDFWRFNPHYMQELYFEQPQSAPGMWNMMEHRPLEGFVFAVTPFNFTSIAGNLPTAPAMMGNVALWKPASSSIPSGFWIMKILEEAGLPPGVINFVPGRGSQVGDPVLASEHLAGLHFTGSTPTFQGMWRTMAENLGHYRGYPRIVGETGGKDFVFAHASSDVTALATALVRGAFEYQGQKCSAASRAYVPSSIWPAVREAMGDMLSGLTMGSPMDFRNFMCAVIDQGSFDTITPFIDRAKASNDQEVVFGGGYDDSTGFFIEPTVVTSADPKADIMCTELFGPVLSVHVYDESKLDEALATCDSTGPYALTGAIFGRDRAVLAKMARSLRHAAGNFYLNDKPTGAVVGQQPFGGGRASGTNDKAGSKVNLIRWVSQRSIKETFVSPTDPRYPHMDEA